MSDEKENLSSVLTDTGSRPQEDAGSVQPSPDEPGASSKADSVSGTRERRRTHSARRARQGQVVLDSPLKKATFFGGLVGIVLLILLLSLFGIIS